MRVGVDANIVAAAGVRPGGWTARELARADVEFVSPAVVQDEPVAHEVEYAEKAKCGREEWAGRVAGLLGRIRLIRRRNGDHGRDAARRRSHPLGRVGDGARLLDPGRMRVYALPDGELEADLLERVLDALTEAGYEPDDRFPGQAGRGTFPLDGDFSPDGTRIVFDGAVRRAGAYGVILAEIGLDGKGFAIRSPLLDVDPSRSNDHNFSQLNPAWI